MSKTESMPLHLVTPPMKGLLTKTLQTLLKVHGWYDGDLDGEFGILTHQAVYRAKFWLGYMNPDHIAGEVLVAYLSQTRKPTLAMRARASLRQRNAKKVSRGLLMVREALTHLGTRESPPESNEVLFSKWYGLVGAWCAMLVSYCANKVGFKQFRPGVWVAYVPYIVSAAREGRNGLTVVHYSGLQDGDVVCYDWNGDGVADHTGFHATEATLRKEVPKALAQAIKDQGPVGAGDFWAVEGNTAYGNDSNGGEVMIRRRHLSQVQLFARIH